MTASAEGRNPTGGNAPGDGHRQNIDHETEEQPLPPARGNSDLRGQTPDDVEPPEDALLVVSKLKKYFPIRKGFLSRHVGDVKAVDGVSFFMRRGETMGLVGESGCGKTTAGRTILRMEEPTAGKVTFQGADVFSLEREDLRKLRRQAQYVFQDPFSSLNPRLTVGDTIREVLRVHKLAEGAAAVRRVGELLEVVGLRAEHAERYPHEFSGGQRQRIGIARALAVEPALIICDEPVSALDVSVQAQVINLLQDLQDEFGLTYLFIAHDLSVVEHISDRVAVMYLGRIVELAKSEALYRNPLMPYTQALLSAAPVAEPGRKRERIVLRGDVPSPANPPSGCPFHPRCHHPLKDADCASIVPSLADKGGGHFVACIKVPLGAGE